MQLQLNFLHHLKCERTLYLVIFGKTLDFYTYSKEVFDTSPLMFFK